jgi:hypothetical protein
VFWKAHANELSIGQGLREAVQAASPGEYKSISVTEGQRAQFDTEHKTYTEGKSNIKTVKTTEVYCVLCFTRGMRNSKMHILSQGHGNHHLRGSELISPISGIGITSLPRILLYAQ